MRTQRWPKGYWMKLTSKAVLRALMEEQPGREAISIAKLARHSGCSKGFISHLLAGRRKTCTPQLAQRIAESLQVPLSILFVPSPPTARRQDDNGRAA